MFTVQERKPCQIILAVVTLIILAILNFIRRQSRAWKIIGALAIVIIIIYYWYCGPQPGFK